MFPAELRTGHVFDSAVEGDQDAVFLDCQAEEIGVGDFFMAGYN